MMKMQKSRGATKTSSRVAAFVAFVAAAVLLEGRGAHAASSGICKTPTNFKPDVTFEAPGFGTQTCQSTVTYWQGQYGQGHVLFVSLLTKNHIGNLLSETTNNTGSLPFDIFHRPKNV